MIITSKRKLTSSVAILCALMILIGIFPMNLFSRNKADAAGSGDYTVKIIYTTSVSGDSPFFNNMFMYAFNSDSDGQATTQMDSILSTGTNNGYKIYSINMPKQYQYFNLATTSNWAIATNQLSFDWSKAENNTLTILVTKVTKDAKTFEYTYVNSEDSLYTVELDFSDVDIPKVNNISLVDSMTIVGGDSETVPNYMKVDGQKYSFDYFQKEHDHIFLTRNYWAGWQTKISLDWSKAKNNTLKLKVTKIEDSGNKDNGKPVYNFTTEVVNDSLQGKTINFKDMTGKLNSNITATFTGDGITAETKNIENNKVTIPNDVDNNSYTTVEFKNGTTSLGKYNLFNKNSSGVTAISYDESTCNTFYYGATEKSDNTVLSYWGASLSNNSSIKNKNLYFKKSIFNSQPTVKINGQNLSLTSSVVDSKDVWSCKIPSESTATQQTIITVEYNGNKYHFLWNSLGSDSVVITDDIMKISDRLNKAVVYFDATLSKLSYKGTNDAKNDGKGMPYSDNDKMYYYATKADKTGAITGEMTKCAEYTDGKNTWKDVWSVSLPDGYTRIRFTAWANPSNEEAAANGDGTAMYDIPIDLEKPCFYADTSDQIIYNGGNRSGYWDEAYTIRDAESGKGSTVVDVTESSFSNAKKSYKSNNEEVYYINSTFYDYYTDYELNGSNRDDYKETNGASQRNWVTFRQFDQALSDLYSENNVSIPIYTGHFQPSISGWGTQFSDIATTLNLYGYNEYNKFFSTNNSSIDINGNEGMYASAAQGLVNDQLDNGNLKTSKGEVNLPHFDEDFLLGNNSKNTKLAGIYKNVFFPFTKQDVEGVDYWVFDSKDTTLAMRKNNDSSSNVNYYLENTGNKDWSKNVNSSSGTKDVSTTYGFFPFNETSGATNANTYNYGFGTKLEFKFRLTKDGTVLASNGTQKNIKFEFSGDDDVWVYIDGKLALDVGGAHGQVTGTIDFGGTDNTKTSTVSKVKASAGSSTSGTEITSNFKLEGSNTDEHTLVMYYMERGMWESNMRVQFNFPDENQLEVEKQVDTTDVNAMFKNLFNENENFEFLIQNRVTHFGEKEASDSTELKTIDFAKDFTGNLSATSASNKFEKVDNKNGQNNVVHWWAMYSNTNNAFTKERLGDLSADDKQPKDISEMTYLTFKAYIANSNPSLNNMYIQLTDKNSKKLYGFLDANKVKDTVLSGNTWSKVTVILNKLTEESGFDKTNISTISFQYNIQCNIYLDDFIFKNDATSTSTGFTTKQEEIPDYGSAKSGKLENAENAQYYKKNDSSTSSKGTLGLVDESGNFYLKNKQLVTFYDQFRRGSYISLTENLSESQKKLYTTTYTVYEDGSAVTSMSTGDKVTNGNISNLKDVSSTQVEDGRIEKTDSDSTAANYDGTKPTGNTLVFRSYANPDDNTNTKLKVQFNNKVNVGKLTITKAQTGNVNLTGKYSFYVEFKNVGGSGLEGANSIVSDVIELGVGESKTITGIPVGTEYIIHEVDNNSEGAVLKTVTSDGKDITISQNTVNGMATHSVTGIVTIANTEYLYIFNNAKIETIELNITKKWFNVNEADEDKYIPTANAVNFRLLRSTDGSTWETVPNYESFTLDSDWKKKITKLDKYADDEQTQWKYSIRELDQEGNQIDNGGMTTITAASGDVNYTVTYTTGNNSADYDSELIVDNTRVIQNISMPETGGEGGSPNQFNFVLFGAIAIALAGGLLLLNKKYAFVHIGKSSKEVR